MIFFIKVRRVDIFYEGEEGGLFFLFESDRWLTKMNEAGKVCHFNSRQCIEKKYLESMKKKLL